jgi:hypothetical protein
MYSTAHSTWKMYTRCYSKYTSSCFNSYPYGLCNLVLNVDNTVLYTRQPRDGPGLLATQQTSAFLGSSPTKCIRSLAVCSSCLIECLHISKEGCFTVCSQLKCLAEKFSRPLADVGSHRGAQDMRRCWFTNRRVKFQKREVFRRPKR